MAANAARQVACLQKVSILPKKKWFMRGWLQINPLNSARLR